MNLSLGSLIAFPLCEMEIFNITYFLRSLLYEEGHALEKDQPVPTELVINIVLF